MAMSPHILASYQASLAVCQPVQKPLGPPVLSYDPALLGGILIPHSDISRENLHLLKGLEESSNGTRSFFASNGAGFFLSNSSR